MGKLAKLEVDYRIWFERQQCCFNLPAKDKLDLPAWPYQSAELPRSPRSTGVHALEWQQG